MLVLPGGGKQTRDAVIGAVNSTNDRDMRIGGVRRNFIPKRSWLVDGNVVPHHRRRIALAKQLRDYVILVPVLGDPHILYPPESEGRRRTEVGRKNRFPDDEHPDSRVALF